MFFLSFTPQHWWAKDFGNFEGDCPYISFAVYIQEPRSSIYIVSSINGDFALRCGPSCLCLGSVTTFSKTCIEIKYTSLHLCEFWTWLMWCAFGMVWQLTAFQSVLWCGPGVTGCCQFQLRNSLTVNSVLQLMFLRRYLHPGQIPLGRCFHHEVYLHLRFSFWSTYMFVVSNFRTVKAIWIDC